MVDRLANARQQPLPVPLSGVWFQSVVWTSRLFGLLIREIPDKPDADLTHSQALEIVAQQLGFRDWNTASARLLTPGRHP